jgi:hypothetical protein
MELVRFENSSGLVQRTTTVWLVVVQSCGVRPIELLVCKLTVFESLR